MNLANEGLEAKMKEEEVNEKKRKAEHAQTWEGASKFAAGFVCILTIVPSSENRDTRVNTWRSFAGKDKKKKKQKVTLLG